MISVPEARKLIDQNARELPSVSCSLAGAAGRLLTADVVSGLDVPPFDQSAMDGYAFQFDDHGRRDVFRVIGVVPAGMHPEMIPKEGEAVRIFTGAPMQEGTDTVVMQEKVLVEGSYIRMEDGHLRRGSNVRLQGTQSRKGTVAMKAGTRLTPGGIGLLASLGVARVEVRAEPRITVIVTGKELIQPGRQLGPGQVYESNSFALAAALKELHLEPAAVYPGDDDEGQITGLLRQAISGSDLVIVTGGISVGDYDLVKKSMDNCEVETVCYKVRQKPGKPMYVGKKEETLLFGLPGNPSAVLTCFYEYLVPAIKKMRGEIGMHSLSVTKNMASDFSKRSGLTYFLKGKLNGEEVVPLPGQESYQMSSFAEADCLIVLDENRTDYLRGEPVEVHFIAR